MGRPKGYVVPAAEKAKIAATKAANRAARLAGRSIVRIVKETAASKMKRIPDFDILSTSADHDHRKSWVRACWRCEWYFNHGNTPYEQIKEPTK